MPSGIPRSAQAMANGWVRDKILHLSDAGVPVDGVTGANKSGPGSFYTDILLGVVYINVGTYAAPLWAPVGEQTAMVTMTNAEALAFRATPKTLVAAPGAARMLRFHNLLWIFDWTAAYVESTANAQVKYNNGAGLAASQAIEATGFADAVADIATTGEAKIDLIGLKTAVENLPLVLHNTGAGEWTGGNAANVFRLKVMYSVWPTGW